MKRTVATFRAVLGALAIIAAAGGVAMSAPDRSHVREIEGLRTAHSLPRTDRTDGVPPVAVLPHQGQPIAAVPSGDRIVLLARPTGTTEIVAYTLDASGKLAGERPTGLRARGFRVGLTNAPDGTIWAGVGATLARLLPNGTSGLIRVPPAQHPLPLSVRGPGPAGLGPVDDGQITSLAVTPGGVLLIGRAGYAEITRFSPASATFDTVTFPPEIGDVEQFSVDGSQIVFTVNHSASQLGSLYDVLGAYEVDSGRVSGFPFRARTVSVSAGRIALAGIDGLTFIEGSALRRVRTQDEYDESRVALRRDGIAVLRAAGPKNQVAFVDPSGREVRREIYQVAVVASPLGGTVPYASTFVFSVVTADGALWFGLYGSRDIYRFAP